MFSNYCLTCFLHAIKWWNWDPTFELACNIYLIYYSLTPVWFYCFFFFPSCTWRWDYQVRNRTMHLEKLEHLNQYSCKHGLKPPCCLWYLYIILFCTTPAICLAITVVLFSEVFFFLCMSAYQIVRLKTPSRAGCDCPSAVTVRTLAAVQSHFSGLCWLKLWACHQRRVQS